MKRNVIIFFLLVLLLFYNYGNAFAIPDTEVEEFVSRLYQLTLNRQPDTSGLRYWVDQLNSGVKSAADVSLNFIFSPEFIEKNTDNINFLNIMYRAFFDREPDSGGFNYWLSKINQGYGRRYILANFVNSKEFSEICTKYQIKSGSIRLNETDKVPRQDSSIGTPVVTDTIRNAIVSIQALNSIGEIIDTGIGYILSRDGIILTNYSYLKEANGGVVMLNDGQQFNIEKVVGHDIYRDIVLVKIPAGNYSTIRLGTLSNYVNNQTVYGLRIDSIGAVEVAKGIVKNIDYKLNNVSFLETSPILLNENKSGLLLNYYGELTGLLLRSKYNSNSNIAIKSELISQLLRNNIDLPASSLKGIKNISVPSNLQLDISADNKIILRWDSIAGAASYNIYRSERQEGPYELLASSTTTSYQSSLLNQNKAYWYAITAVQGVLESSLSSPIVISVLNQGRTQYEVEPNDTIYQANIYSIGTIRDFNTLNGTIRGTEIDYYQINIFKNGYLRLRGNSSLKSGGLLVIISDSNNEIFATKLTDSAGNFDLRMYVTVGKYYIALYPSGASTGVTGTYSFYGYLE